ncbi:MAG: ATP-binding protein [Deferribacteraceae bacterium]|jgi:anti-sigma regulatory factor (Ser/Thr protein kinase)|nr:ATP-binding protein [Deferribacteraceae bacterium]
MKRIAYLLQDKEIETVLLKFCKDENLTPVAVEKLPYKESVLLFISDDHAALDAEFSPDARLCLIADSVRAGSRYCTLNRNFTETSLKQLMDELFHGGRLWNMVKDINFTCSVKEVVIGNNLSEVDRFVCLITEDILHFCDYSTLEKIRVGLSEMITNAIEHGNLNISSEEKHEATEAGVFRDLVKARLADERYKNRLVRCRVGVFADRADFIISDEGGGFDTSELPTPDDSECLLNLHGRGIYITQAYFDKVTYDAKGSTVYLVKRFG